MVFGNSSSRRDRQSGPTLLELPSSESNVEVFLATLTAGVELPVCAAIAKLGLPSLFRSFLRCARLAPFVFLLQWQAPIAVAESSASAKSGGVEIIQLDRVARKVPSKQFRAATAEDGVVLTARSLFLNQELSSYVLTDPSANSLGWSYGSLIGGLRLEPQTLQTWQGKTLLDVAGGASILADEAVEVLGVTSATVVDFNMELYKRRMVNEDFPPVMMPGPSRKNREAAAIIYGENMRLLSKSGLLRSTPWPGTKGEWVHLLDTAIAKEKATGASYFSSGPTAKVRRLEGNALMLSELVGVNQFDVSINSWMMMYLNEPNRIAAIIELIRVTKPGGQVRIQGGEEGADGAVSTGYVGEQIDGSTPAVTAQRFAIWFAAEKCPDDGTYWMKEYVSAKSGCKASTNSGGPASATPKRVKINEQSVGTLLVLDVI